MPEVGKCRKCPVNARTVVLYADRLCLGHFKGEPVERSERITELKAIAKVPIKKVSDKKKEELKVYKVAKKQFFKDNPKCKIRVAGCTDKTQDVHHPEGRIGDKLLELDKCVPACRNCHNWAETHPIEAKKLGVSKSRLKKEK